MIAVISPPRVSVSIIHGFTWIVQHADNYLAISNIERWRLLIWGYINELWDIFLTIVRWDKILSWNYSGCGKENLLSVNINVHPNPL